MGNLLATTYNTTGSGSGVGVFLILALVFYVLVSLGLYGTFIKAGQPGWAGFVPIYNFIVLLRVAGRPKTWGWFLLMLIIPYIGSLAFFVVYIIVANDVSKSFGHGAAFTVGLVIPYVSAVFYYILWLGPSQYRGPAAAMGGGYGGGYPPRRAVTRNSSPAIRPPVAIHRRRRRRHRLRPCPPIPHRPGTHLPRRPGRCPRPVAAGQRPGRSALPRHRALQGAGHIGQGLEDGLGQGPGRRRDPARRHPGAGAP